MLNTVLLIFTAFVVKHFVVDFVLQSQYMAENKHIYTHHAGWHHALLHGYATVAIIAFTASVGLGQVQTGQAWMVILIGLTEAVVHHAIDWAKMNTEIHYGLTVDDHGFWLLIGFDQMLHMLSYLIIIWVVWSV